MADTTPRPEIGIFRVQHALTVGKATMVAESDLIFDAMDRPLLVLEWQEGPKGQMPLVSLVLDRARLVQQKRHGYFSYDGPLVDPRSSS